MRNTDDKQLDELLGNAFKKQLENELNNGPSDNTLDAMYPFTEEQMKRAKELSRKNKKQSFMWRSQLGRVAAVILCVTTAAGAISLTNPIVRGHVSNTVTYLIDEYISIDFADATDDERIDISKTRITYIPEGFSLENDNSDKDSISHIYQSPEGEYIIIDIEESGDINLMTDVEAHRTEFYRINGYEGYISYSEDLGQGSVYFGSSYFTVAISGMTEKDELIKIAENIKFKD
ncbi:MAG: DUF4367 domain-containing protein [Clostridia bacterium]|nr:DUF4367 domain-containing protein [Clostridia bacterium]